ncbi:hypothetical protein KKH24_02850, partial [Patescibacteria group bacterium]|nr:hypothetical protein [Patescibacteria group bacterium]
MMKKLKTAFTMQKLKAVLNKQDIAKTTSIEIGGVDSYPMIGEKCYCIFYVRDAVNSAKFSSLLTVCESYGVRPVIFGKRMTRENADKVLSSQRFAIEKNMRTKKIGVSYEEKQLENDRLKRKYQMILEIEAKLDDKDGKEKSDYVCECNMLLVLYASDSKTLDTVDKKFKSVMRGMGFYLVTPVEQKVIYEKKLIRKEESSIDDEYRLYFTGEMMDSFMKYAFPASQQYKSGLPIGRRKNGEYIFFDPAKTKAGGRGIYIGESESGKTHLLLLQMYNDTILGKRQAYLDPLGAVKTSNSPLKAAERIKERFKNKKVYIQKYTYTEDTAGIDLFNVFP